MQLKTWVLPLPAICESFLVKDFFVPIPPIDVALNLDVVMMLNFGQFSLSFKNSLKKVLLPIPLCRMWEFATRESQKFSCTSHTSEHFQQIKLQVFRIPLQHLSMWCTQLPFLQVLLIGSVSVLCLHATLKMVNYFKEKFWCILGTTFTIDALCLIL